MAILVDENTKLLIQGITGKNASFHAKLMKQYGTKILAGVTPGKRGETIEDIPVFDTVFDAKANYPEINTTSIWVPPLFAKDAILEAIDANIKNIIVITERIPIHDMLYARKKAIEKGINVVGGNTPGIISPEKALVGMLPRKTFRKGHIGTVARSGAITYYLANTLNLAGYGESTSVGIGGDPILGMTFGDILKLFDEDPDTHAVIMAGEIGGVYEEMAKETIKNMKKPVLAFISGRYAPKGKRMGHAGAIVEGNLGTAQSKIDALREAGATILETFSEIPLRLKELNILP